MSEVYEEVRQMGIKNPIQPTLEDFERLIRLGLEASEVKKKFILAYFQIWADALNNLKDEIRAVNEEKSELIKEIIGSANLVVVTLKTQLEKDLSKEERNQIYEILSGHIDFLARIITESNLKAPEPPVEKFRIPEHTDREWVDYAIPLLLGVIAGAAILEVGITIGKSLQRDTDELKGLLGGGRISELDW